MDGSIMNAKETLDCQPPLPYSRVPSQPGNRGKHGKNWEFEKNSSNEGKIIGIKERKWPVLHFGSCPNSVSRKQVEIFNNYPGILRKFIREKSGNFVFF